MVPVRKSYDCVFCDESNTNQDEMLGFRHSNVQDIRTIVHVVQVTMGIFWVIYNEWPAQTITVLNALVAVIPKRACNGGIETRTVEMELRTNRLDRVP